MIVLMERSWLVREDVEVLQENFVQKYAPFGDCSQLYIVSCTSSAVPCQLMSRRTTSWFSTRFTRQ